MALSFAAVSPAQAGPTVADSGFEIDSNGFSFPNYGNEDGFRNLNSSQMRRLFGSDVCLTGRGSGCVLSPAARSWMNEMNEAMGGGHCYGFATLAWMIQRDQLPRFGYSSLTAFGGGTDAFDLNIVSNGRLQAAIARAWTLQLMPAVVQKKVEGSPRKILRTLRRELTPQNPETYAMTIFQPGFEAGHAITPMSVEDLGDGKFGVRVYDNNWPADGDRVLTIDTTKNSWSYVAAANPNEPDALYKGNARTETLQLMPTRPGFRLHDCTFCVGRKGERSKFNEVNLSSSSDEHAHLLITDQKGRQTGFINDKLVNEIPGARVKPRTAGGPQISETGDVTGVNSLEPTYLIPKRLGFKIKVDGSNLSFNDRESVNVVGPTFDASVENLRVGPGKNAHLTLSPRKRTLSFNSGKLRSRPTATFGSESRRAAYRIRITAPGAPPRTKLFFAEKPKRSLLRIGTKSKDRQRYRVQINRHDKLGLATSIRSYSIRGRQQAYLLYGPLVSPKGRARIVIREPGKGKVRTLKVKQLPSAG